MIEKFNKIKEMSESLDVELETLKSEVELKQKEYQEKVSEASKLTQITQGLDEEEFKKFLKEPYSVLPTGKQEEWFVAVPKFIRMNLGWLDHTTETYNIFRINKFMKWLGNIPMDIEKKFKFDSKLPLKIFDGKVLSGKEHQAETWNKYHGFLTGREGNDKLKIKKGYEFKLLAQLIGDGILPFMPKPLEEGDLRDANLEFELRDYQQEGWEKFKEVGAVGAYWAYSAGKTFFGLYAGARLKGKKFVVCPTTTLVEQWTERIRKYLPRYVDEFEVVTYHSFHKLKNKEYILGIFDECQHLPANTFSKFATLNMKYRIGLSATPYREDGRTDYIFALTGFPIGLSWDNLIELGVLEIPDVRVYIVSDWRAKEKKLKEILATGDKKTIIFCDSIQLGNKVSKELGVPFIHGGTTKRLEIINEADVSIVSRVGDEGLSIPELQRVIEIDFLFGSRRQEGQRLGRLFHGEDKGEHFILMTEKEFEDHGKRLHAITEKGIKLEIIR